MPGHNGGFNPFRDGNGEFTDQGGHGKPGRNRSRRTPATINGGSGWRAGQRPISEGPPDGRTKKNAIPVGLKGKRPNRRVDQATYRQAVTAAGVGWSKLHQAQEQKMFAQSDLAKAEGPVAIKKATTNLKRATT